MALYHPLFIYQLRFVVQEILGFITRAPFTYTGHDKLNGSPWESVQSLLLVHRSILFE